MQTALRRCVVLGLIAATLVSVVMAQDPKPVTGKWISVRRHEEAVSRAAFAACDANGEDRLNIFEARYSLERMGTLEDPTGFRELDTDKDGQLSWPEFDKHYRTVCGRGGTFRFRPARPYVRPTTTKSTSPVVLAARMVLKLGDTNKDGALNQEEFTKLLVEFKQPAAMAQGFPLLDTDRSGSVGEQELMVLVNNVPALISLARAEARRQKELRMASADLDQDGKVTQKEFDRVFLTLHPTLGRWSKHLWRRADQNRDGKLEGPELLGEKKK